MNSIIYLLALHNQYLQKQINQLLLFIAKYIPLKTSKPDDSTSPKYNKFVVDELPIIYTKHPISYEFLLAYYKYKYDKIIKPVNYRTKSTISKDTTCPRCGAPHDFLYDNNGSKGQYLCKICSNAFNKQERFNNTFVNKCPFCNKALIVVKERKNFRVHKCIDSKCSYYLQNLKKLPKDLADTDKHKYKLHYIYREFTVDFFKMDLSSLPENAQNFNFKKFNAHILGLCLTFHVNLNQSTRQTSLALKMLYGITISHTTVANYITSASAVIKPFVDNYDYNPSRILSADETYIKVKGLKYYVWFIIDVCKKSIISYQVSSTRDVGPCILAIRKALSKFKSIPTDLKFIADGYIAYPLAAQQFKIRENIDLEITQVIGLTNDDVVSTEYRWIKQIIERLNRTFKYSYRVTNGYNIPNGALYGVSLWVAYYNFLRPNAYDFWRPLNVVDTINSDEIMPAQWLALIYLSQKTILEMKEKTT